MTTASDTSAEVERLSRIVADAWTATAPVAGEVDRATRQAAFTLVLETMLQNGAELHSDPDRDPLDDAFATETQRADAIADYLGIVHEGIADLYDVGGREPKLRLNSTQVSQRSADATREIALLVVAARAALGLESGIHNIREAVVAHHKLDIANFDRALTEMTEISVRGSHGSPNRRVRLRGKGVEAARALARQLAYR